MQKLRVMWVSTAIVVLGAFSGCGGGGTSPSPSAPNAAPATGVPLDYLAKYQGTWIQGCKSIFYGGATYGPSASRKKFVISAPDAQGKISIDSIEDYFDTYVTCNSLTSPKVSVKESISTTATFVRVQSLFLVGNENFDVLNLSQPQSAVIATGSGYSLVTVAGVQKLRITFSGGEALDIDAVTPAFNGEFPIFLGGFNGIGNAIYTYAEGITEAYVKQE
jgi:hypothetical protein